MYIALEGEGPPILSGGGVRLSPEVWDGVGPGARLIASRNGDRDAGVRPPLHGAGITTAAGEDVRGE